MNRNLFHVWMPCLIMLSALFVTCTEPEVEPTALFSFVQKGNVITFSNVSRDAQSYVWEFGDGENSTEENPVHTYTKAGEYVVLLTATNVTKTNKYSQNIVVSQSEFDPIAKFVYDAKDLTIWFNNRSTNAQSYKWDFGDGKNSTEQNPTHSYSASGTYKVSLTAINGQKSDIYSLSITLNEQDPKAGFSYKANGLTVSFTNTSTNAKSYSWDFGDGKTSTDKNTNHTYSKEGTYKVTLTATNVTKTNKYSQNLTLSLPAPKASFTYTPKAPLTVIFSNTSTNATSFEWDFGDGITSTEKNPTHRYANVSSYTITLVAKNSTASAEYRETIKLSAPKVYVKGIEYELVGKEDKYYRCVCKDDETWNPDQWWTTNYTPLLNESKLPYKYIFSSPVEITDLDDDKYVYVYWNNTTSGDGTQILKQKMSSSNIKTYPDFIWLMNDNFDTSIYVLFEYK